MSEGLSAVYRFETGIDTSANQSGRLNYVGLSGGFGNLTLGRIWSASYNHAGVLRDFPNWYTSGDTSGRVGSALSYAMSTDAFSMQIDAIMDSGTNTGDAVDQLEFGMTVSLGDIGKIAFAHVNKQDTLHKEAMVVTPAREAADAMFFLVTEDADEMEMETPLTQIMVWTNATGNVNDDDELIDAGGIMFDPAVMDDPATQNNDESRPASYHDGNCAPTNAEGMRPNGCVSAVAYFSDTTTTRTTMGTHTADGDGMSTVPADTVATTTARTYIAPGEQDGDMDANTIRTVAAVTAADEVTTMIDTPGSKSSHVSAEFGLGAITGAVGYSETKTNGMSGKDKVTFLGVSGSIGDTGMNWGAWSRKKTTAAGGESKPWTVGLNKGLGDGAKAYIEHGNDGEDGSTVVGLVVNF